MFNTIILLKRETRLSKNEYKNFHKGDTIFGDASNPEEIMRWGVDDEDEAKKN